MKSTGSYRSYLNKILQDESLHREWENLYNTSSGNLTDTDFLASKTSKSSSDHELSHFLKNAHFSFDMQESVMIGGQKHTPDMSFYREKLQEMIQINIIYRQKTNEIKDTLIQAISFIQ